MRSKRFMNLSIFDLLHPEDITRATSPIQDLQTGQVATIKGDMRYQRKDQETLWASINSTAIQDAKGYVPYFLVQIQDITEQKIAETQLQATLVSQQQQLEISHAFAAAQTEDEVLDAIIQKAAIYPQAAVSITYWEAGDEGERFDIVQRQNAFESGIEITPEGSRTPWKESPIANHYTADDFFISNDLPQDSQLHQSVRKSFAGAGINSLAIFPIVASGDWLGNIAVMSKEQGFFSAQVTSLFRFLAEQGSIALRAAILFAKTQRSLERRNREVALTIQIAQDVATASNPHRFIQKSGGSGARTVSPLPCAAAALRRLLDTVALIYGYGETGQKMVALNHSMPLGVGLIGAAAATAQTTYRGNVAQDPDWRPNPLLPKTRSEIAVPIKLRNEVLGVLDVQSDRLNAFNEEDHLLLEGLCGQIAVAIESTRLREEMDTRINELTTLQRYMSREGWESYQRIKQGAVSGYQFDHQGVAALVDTLDLNIQPGNGESGERKTAVSPTHTETSLTVLGGEVIGKLGVHTDDNDPLSEDELDFIQSISAQVAEALEAARLFEQTQDALSEQERLSTQLETVAQVSTAAATMLEVDALLQAVVDLTKASFNLYHTHIYLMGYNDHTLVLRAGADQVGRLMTLEGRQIRLSDESIVARAARQKKDGIVENDVRKIVDFLPNPLLPHTRAELAVPLIIGDKVIGVLDLQADQTDFFTEEDVNIHRTLASQIAVAVQMPACSPNR
ncbi:MAG: GAF domain-containing protein [Chloroflexi bacterium]|nr:GAF domain-containing protein [Chloroflexota bacterium]